jgi:HAD superfamily hydrolase (TIGR01458 family)
VNKPSGFLIDLDGVLYIENTVIPGAIEAVNWLRRQGYPFRFLTNTTMKSASTLIKKLTGFGIEASPAEMFSTSVVAARWLAREGISKVQLLVAEDTQKDFFDFQITAVRPQAVVMGDMGRQFNFDVLNAAFVSIKAGARLVALQKNRFWRTETGPALDAGAWVAALEYAAEVEAELIGKPNRAYFETALDDLGLPAPQVAMIGDDIHTDILGARAVGAKTILVRTGKYVFDRDKHEDVRPDWSLDSIADLPSLISIR